MNIKWQDLEWVITRDIQNNTAMISAKFPYPNDSETFNISMGFIEYFKEAERFKEFIEKLEKAYEIGAISIDTKKLLDYL